MPDSVRTATILMFGLRPCDEREAATTLEVLLEEHGQPWRVRAAPLDDCAETVGTSLDRERDKIDAVLITCCERYGPEEMEPYAREVAEHLWVRPESPYVALCPRLRPLMPIFMERGLVVCVVSTPAGFARILADLSSRTRAD
mgnify:CR=1 FL=1